MVDALYICYLSQTFSPIWKFSGENVFQRIVEVRESEGFELNPLRTVVDLGVGNLFCGLIVEVVITREDAVGSQI